MVLSLNLGGVVDVKIVDIFFYKSVVSMGYCICKY